MLVSSTPEPTTSLELDSTTTCPLCCTILPSELTTMYNYPHSEEVSEGGGADHRNRKVEQNPLLEDEEHQTQKGTI